jgi:hypothetical protein
MAQQTHSAGMEGAGTTKSEAANLASSSLATVTGAALPALCKHADIRIVTGTVYIENNGTAANANSMPFEAGEKWQIRNCQAMLANLRFFADVAYDMRITLYL